MDRTNYDANIFFFGGLLGPLMFLKVGARVQRHLQQGDIAKAKENIRFDRS